MTETSIKQGEENLRINKDRYQEQVGTATDVIDAQTLLTQIKTEHYQALFDYRGGPGQGKTGPWRTMTLQSIQSRGKE